MTDYQNFIETSFGVNGKIGLAILLLVTVWELIWKGMALWKASRQGATAWFVCLLIFNTVGILPILYIYVFSQKDEPKPQS